MRNCEYQQNAAGDTEVNARLCLL